jgi:MoxR-like ATPase
MKCSEFIQIEPETAISLAARGHLPEQVHVFDEQSINAVNVALAARRPLLVRGEPGTGKSQMARAAAKALGRAYVQYVVDARTEPRDLLWRFDAVARLAEAQLRGATDEDSQQVRIRLRVENYLQPGPLWWAFDWNDAARQATLVHEQPPIQVDGGDCQRGCVVLVDEIDKAESDVPNGLLEALGAGQFTPLGRAEPVEAKQIAPLVVITTNEERSLPDAFVRRCMVLFLPVPAKSDELIELLVRRGRAHFADVDEKVLRAGAELLAKDRDDARKAQLTPLPGQAEYLDLVRAVRAFSDDAEGQVQTLERISAFALKKHLGSVL